MTLHCKDNVLSHGELNFYLSSKIKCCDLVTVKRSDFFAVQIMISKNKFLKTIHRKELSRKETCDIDL